MPYGQRSGELKNAFVSWTVVGIAVLAGCAVRTVQDELVAHCAKLGKHAFLTGLSQNEFALLIDSATATGVCLGPGDVGRLPAAFGADIILMQITGRRGVGVYSVRPGSAAAVSGLKSGDFIIEYRGRPITRPAELQSAIDATSLKEQVIIKFRRGDGVISGTAQF
jgi:hypothetical protein